MEDENEAAVVMAMGITCNSGMLFAGGLPLETGAATEFEVVKNLLEGADVGEEISGCSHLGFSGYAVE